MKLSYKSITDKKIPKCITSDYVVLLEGANKTSFEGLSFPITTLTWQQRGILELLSSAEETRKLFNNLKQKCYLKRSTIDELRDLCNEFNIPMIGTRELLINRILEANNKEGGNSSVLPAYSWRRVI